jgi:uncharacterized coiled-coil protein SlyX
MTDTTDEFHKAVYAAVKQAIEEVGLETVKKMSCFKEGRDLMTDTTHDDLVKRLANARCEGLDELCWAAADRIEELEANINLKADFIDATMNQLAASDQRIAELEAKLAKAVEQEMVRVCNAYAKDGNMIAATAIHDAWLCVQDTLAELNYDERSEKKGQGDD